MTRWVKFIPAALLITICSLIYSEFVFFGKVPLPADTLVGAYFPWLDYKWGYAVGVPVKNALTSDAFSTFFVWKKIIADMYSNGIVPLWNKYSLTGTPLMATFHSTVFNPANVLLLIPNLGWSLYIFGGSLAAALSMYLFLGSYIKNKIAGIVGALIFAFSGPMTTWAEFGTATLAAATIPLILHFLRKALLDSKPIHFFSTTLFTALLIFSGHVQIFTYTFAIIPLFVFFVIRKEKCFNNRKLLLVLLSLMLGIGMGLIQLLPTQEFYKRSIRGEERYASGFNYGLSPLRESIRLVAADIFGHPARGNHFSPVSYHEYSSYLGALSLPVILYLCISGGLTSTSLFFIILFASSLFLAIDHPVSRLIFSLPFPLLTYSSASRLFFVTGFSGASLVALGLEKLGRTKADIKPLIVSLLFSILFILISLTQIDYLHRNISLKNSIVYLGLLSVYLFSTPLLRKHKTALVMLALFLFSLDLGRYFNSYNTFVKRDIVFPTTPVIEWLQKQPQPFRIARENTALFPPNTWTAYGIESIEGYDPLYSLDYARFFHIVNGKSYTDAVSRYALLEKVNKKYLDALNVKYFLTVIPLSNESESSTLFDVKKNGLKEVFRDGRVSVFENPDALDRAYFVDEIIPAQDIEEAFRLINRPSFNPRTEAVVIQPGNLIASITGNSIFSIDQKDNSVRINLTSEKGGFLVISDSFDPGWKAKSNGVAVNIYQTDAALMGIAVSPGSNIIELTYLPNSFIYGALISLTAFTVAIITFLFLKIKRPTL